MSYISEACLISVLWIVHTTFSLYIYINLYAKALFRICRNIIGGTKTEGVRELKSCLEKIPNHIAFILLENWLDYDVLANLVAWSLVLGIQNISLYDVKGRLKQNQHRLLIQLNHKLKESLPHQPITITWRPHAELINQDRTVIVSKNGVMYPDINGNGRIQINAEAAKKCEHSDEREGLSLNLSLLSQHDGKEDIVRCARLLSDKIVRGNALRVQEINEDCVDEHLSCNRNLPDPSLVVRLGMIDSNADFLPWQLRLSEIHSIDCTVALSPHQFTDVIRKYSKCDQRFGK